MKEKLKNIVTNLIGTTIEINGETQTVNKILFLRACSEGDLALIKKLTGNKYKNFINRQVRISALNKPPLFVPAGDIYESGFRQAAYSGKYEIFEFLIDKYAKEIINCKKDIDGVANYLVSVFTGNNIEVQNKMVNKLLEKGFEIPPQTLSYAFINNEVNEKLIDFLYKMWIKEDINFNKSRVFIREILKILEEDNLEVFDFLYKNKILNSYGRKEFKIIMNEINYLNIRVGFDEYKEKIRSLIKKELHHKKLTDEMTLLNIKTSQKSKKKI